MKERQPATPGGQPSICYRLQLITNKAMHDLTYSDSQLESSHVPQDLKLIIFMSQSLRMGLLVYLIYSFNISGSLYINFRYKL